MTDFKPGDRIQFKIRADGARLNGALDLTLAYLGTETVVYTWKSRNTKAQPFAMGEATMTRDRFDAEVEKIEPFFETGKAYEHDGYRFTPTSVVEDSDGSPVAFGRTDTPDGGHIWQTKRRHSYPIWSEVDDD